MPGVPVDVRKSSWRDVRLVRLSLCVTNFERNGEHMFLRRDKVVVKMSYAICKEGDKCYQWIAFLLLA